MASHALCSHWSTKVYMDQIKILGCTNMVFWFEGWPYHFPLTQALQTFSSLNLVLGKPTTMSLEFCLFSCSRLACSSLLCQRRGSFLIALRHVTLVLGIPMISTLHLFLCLLAVRAISLLFIFFTLHPAEVKITLLLLSNNYEIPSKLCFNPSTWYIFQYSWFRFANLSDSNANTLFTISKWHISPLNIKSKKFFYLSPVICLEQELSMYKCHLPPFTRTCKTI